MPGPNRNTLVTKTSKTFIFRDTGELFGRVLTEQNLADPDNGFDAAMDDRVPCDASPEMLRQTERCLFNYLAWLLDEALPRHPSWTEDEVRRAVLRLVKIRAAAKAARPKIH